MVVRHGEGTPGGSAAVAGRARGERPRRGGRRSRRCAACFQALRRWTRRVVANFWQNFARFRLYRHRSLQENTRFSAFFKIYQIIQLKILKFGTILQILQHLQFFAEFSRKLLMPRAQRGVFKSVD